MKILNQLKTSNSYKNLPPRFYEKTCAQKFTSIELLAFNNDLLSKLLGTEIKSLDDNTIVDIFGGQKVYEEFSNLAQVYSGHQFGHFSPRLGDGRALLLVELLDTQNKRFDIHLKGSGQTSFSRRGDGKSALGPVIREYILCELMAALNVPTTRALAAFKTNEKVMRETSLDGGMFARVASSHIRVGTFEYFSSTQDYDGLKALADYSIDRHYPFIEDNNQKYLKLIKEVATNQAKMIAHWMSLGFIHGVMNTDNMLISGETIDYGPCAFMDNFSHSKVFSSIDRNGRYAYSNQINIGIWNLYRFASTLIALVDHDEEESINKIKNSLAGVEKVYEHEYNVRMNAKLGIRSSEKPNLTTQFLDLLERNSLDFTNSFKDLTYNSDKFKDFQFYKQWLKLNPDIELMKSSNPCFIARNHLVEKAIAEAYKGDFSFFFKMNEAVKKPFQNNSEFEKAPTLDEEVTQTFCGT